MRVALAQINSTLGDFKANRQLILDNCQRALDRRCDLVVFPEASLFGYHPVDLLERPSVVEHQLKELDILSRQLPPGIVAIVGAITTNPRKRGKPYHNSAVVLRAGKRPKIFAKTLLPTYDVFDEARHIEPGDVRQNIFRWKGHRILITICEDMWAWPNKKDGVGPTYDENPLKRVPRGDVDIVVNLSASPFTKTKSVMRQHMARQLVSYFRSPLVYVNMVGAQDELIFDGSSFVLDKKGKEIASCLRFEEDLGVVDLSSGRGAYREKVSGQMEIIRRALVLGIRDFIIKQNVEKVHLGLSGGIDSSLVACLACDALGPHRVSCIGMSGPFSRKESLLWAEQLTQHLGCEWVEAPITSLYEQAERQVIQGFGETPFGLVQENLQARLRCLILMAYSNKHLSILLNTSNKSELAMGYTTLYGDAAGGLSPLGDLLKTEVYQLAAHYNAQAEVIPQGILDRPPSAELRPNQKDEDTLPPYSELDPAINKMVNEFKAPRGALEKRILKSLMKSEFKRWQAPPILKISDHAFGRGRRLPVAHRAIY